jgi:hypothetical protein
MKSEEENFESIISGKHQKINSTFTPIGRAYSRTQRFWPSHLKSKIEEIKEFKKSKFKENRRFKKSKIEEVEELKIDVWRLNPSLQLELSLGGY